jgi:DNA primase small subunit
MRDPTLDFVMRKFSEYYRSEEIELPERLARREFGFMFFDRNFVLRHIGFRNREELRGYIVDNVPAHIYHSSAYYENPNMKSMVDKGWMGADLVFDLDADHVKEAENKSYPKMLALVKRELVRLIDEFIEGDLGFDVDSLKIVFSGGRGYHVHVPDPRVLKLGSQERREIVDYITATGLDFEWIFPTKPFSAGQYGDRTYPKFKIHMPNYESGGWRRRIAAGIRQLIIDLEVLGEDEVVKRYSDLKDQSGRAIGERSIRAMYRELFERHGIDRGADRIRKENTLEVFSKQAFLSAFIRIVEEHARLSLVGETDEPVTSDIKRLIRLPSSLHGKTGLRVTTLTRDALGDFDPLRDAVPENLSDDEVAMEAEKSTEIALRGQKIAISEGENRVPEFAALFFACRKLARVI